MGNSKVTGGRKSGVPRSPLATSSNWEGNIWEAIGMAISQRHVFFILLGTRRASFEDFGAGAVQGGREQVSAPWQLDCAMGGLMGGSGATERRALPLGSSSLPD